MECLKLLKCSLTRRNNNRNIGQDSSEMQFRTDTPGNN